MTWIPQIELEKMGFAELGQNVLISDKTSIYNNEKISLGNNIRIDDFCVLSAGQGGIVIGNFVHIAVYCSLIGQETIVMDDFSGLSSRVSIYSSSDDYTGRTLTNPTVPSEFTKVTSKKVHLGKHVIVGAGSVLLPGVKMEQGSAVGALSLVNRSFPEFAIISGTPARRIAERKQDLLEKEKSFLSSID